MVAKPEGQRCLTPISLDTNFPLVRTMKRNLAETKSGTGGLRRLLRGR